MVPLWFQHSRSLRRGNVCWHPKPIFCVRGSKLVDEKNACKCNETWKACTKKGDRRWITYIITYHVPPVINCCNGKSMKIHYIVYICRVFIDFIVNLPLNSPLGHVQLAMFDGASHGVTKAGRGGSDVAEMAIQRLGPTGTWHLGFDVGSCVTVADSGWHIYICVCMYVCICVYMHIYL